MAFASIFVSAGVLLKLGNAVETTTTIIMAVSARRFAPANKKCFVTIQTRCFMFVAG